MNKTKRWVPFVFCGFIIAAVVLSFFPIRTLYSWLFWPYPIEYRDAASIDAAIAIHDGINIYSIENYPNHMYYYGGLLPLLTAFFLNYLRPSFRIPYAINLISLAVCIFLLAWVFFRKISSSLIRWIAIIFSSYVLTLLS